MPQNRQVRKVTKIAWSQGHCPEVWISCKIAKLKLLCKKYVVSFFGIWLCFVSATNKKKRSVNTTGRNTLRSVLRLVPGKKNFNLRCRICTGWCSSSACSLLSSPHLFSFGFNCSVAKILYSFLSVTTATMTYRMRSASDNCCLMSRTLTCGQSNANTGKRERQSCCSCESLSPCSMKNNLCR